MGFSPKSGPEATAPSLHSLEVMVANHYKELIIWQLANELREEVYRLVRGSGAARDFAFRDQLQDAVDGIGANIADGFPRDSSVDFARFVTYAYCCLAETEDRLAAGQARRYWAEEDLPAARKLIRRLTRGISEFLKYLYTPLAAERARNLRRRRLSKPGTTRRQPRAKPSEPDEPDEPVEPVEPVEPGEPGEPDEPA